MSRMVKPYGDTMNDGKMQLSFTLPVQWSEAADEAARQLVAKMGFTDVQVVEGRSIATGFSFFVVYASTQQAVDVESIKAPSARAHAMSMEQIDAFVLDESFDTVAPFVRGSTSAIYHHCPEMKEPIYVSKWAAHIMAQYYPSKVLVEAELVR